ncbi:MAG: DNA polymerase Y family protein [Nitriliruptoraceae bacterium]
MSRSAVLWLADWPLTAADVPADEPVAVLRGDRVLASTPEARRQGVRRGLRRRQAQTRCPELRLVEDDPMRDARRFEPVVATVLDLVPATQVLRPGLVVSSTRGPARIHGGEVAFVDRLRSVVDAGLVDGAPTSRVGVADTCAVAILAARRASPTLHVDPGGDADFCAPLPVEALREMVDHDPAHALRGHTRYADTSMEEFIAGVRRLGITTLGALAVLPRRSIADRFGETGRRAHLLARGDDPHRLAPQDLVEDLQVRRELDPPAEHAEAVAFATRRTAEDLLHELARRGLVCRVVAITVETEHGERLERHWRSSDGFDAPTLVERLRWQLDGWLSAPVTSGEPHPTGGICLVELSAVEVLRGGRQLTLSSGPSDEQRRAYQAVTRLEGLLGPDHVFAAREQGGRGPGSWVVTVPWEQRETFVAAPRPWPGRIPPPAPATIPTTPTNVELCDETGGIVAVSARGEISAPPARVRAGSSGGWIRVVSWSGPWLADERWWERGGRRVARLQIVDDTGVARLLVVESGRWAMEARYD